MLPILATLKSSDYRVKNTPDSEKCSDEIESLSLCAENSSISVNLGESISIKLLWKNSSGIGRYIERRSLGYFMTVTDKNGRKLIPIFEQRFIEKQKQMRKTGEEDRGIIVSSQSGGDRGLYAEANGVEKDEIRLANVRYDYDLTAKGSYSVTISRKVPSLEEGKAIEFVIDDIEIEVK